MHILFDVGLNGYLVEGGILQISYTTRLIRKIFVILCGLISCMFCNINNIVIENVADFRCCFIFEQGHQSPSLTRKVLG